ncbi:MAG: sodium-dependent transporter [Cellvibrionaceae bacterium]
MDLKQGINGQWRNRWTFILAAAGSAVGLGNIWKFPYITGENGGGAFVLVYLVCIALIGIPIMLAEVMLGRRGRMSPINAMLYLSRESKVSHWWSGVGWSGVMAGIFILSFYSVIAGWALHYFILALSGEFYQIDAQASGAVFSGLLANVGGLTLWHTIFLLVTLSIVAAGVVKGLGVAVRYIMPLLFILMGILVIYSAIVGDFFAAFHFLFDFNGQALKWEGVLVALGHAFFTLSLGMGAIMAYGAYLPDKFSATNGEITGKISLGKTVLIIAALDTIVALMAGLVIFPIVFSNPSIEPSAGPGLLFVSLPIAFGGMFAGSFFASLFFFLIFIAALSSAISLIEPTVAWLVEVKQWPRVKITFLLGAIVWIVGLGTVFSFNIWSDLKILGSTFFDMLDFLTANIMLPLGGLLIAIFVGWVMKPSIVKDEVGDIHHGYYRWWYMILRYLSPILLALVFVITLINKLGS